MKKLNVLIACECSGVIRQEFRKLGHNAYSCDIKDAEDGSPHHIMGDAIEAVRRGCEIAPGIFVPWDLVIAHPTCRFLSNSGVQWLYLPWPVVPGQPKREGRSGERDMERWRNMRAGAKFFADLWNACGDIPKAFENPIMHGYGAMEITMTASVPFGKHPDYQIIQPWQYGHTESKATGFSLHRLPRLVPTKIVYNEMMALPIKERSKVHYASPGPQREANRSRTLVGIGQAIAAQWSAHLVNNSPL